VVKTTANDMGVDEDVCVWFHLSSI